MPKIIIHITVVEHMSGMDIYADRAEEAVIEQVASYCRDKWETTSRAESGCKRPPPENHQRCVDLYFEDHESDALTTHVSSVEVPFPDVRQLMDAHHRRAFVESLESSMDMAGGHAVWDEVKHMSLDEVSDILGRNGVLFRSVRLSSDAQAALQQAAENIVKSYPYLK